MIERVSITFEMLSNTLKSFPKEVVPSRVTESFMLGLAVLKSFLGEDWINSYITPNTAKKNFLKIDGSSPRRYEETAFRVIDLAEVLFNLQKIEGIEGCINRMQSGDIEGVYAELDLGRMLYLHHVNFKYVTPSGTKQSDYDVQLYYPDGTMACTDAKCKIEATQLSENGIRNVLSAGRKQLPPDMPGIIFVKIPPHWMEEANLADITKRVAEEFLRGTGRIVSVKYYVSPVELKDQMMIHQHAFQEINNPTNRFDPKYNWQLFKKHQLLPEWNGMPPHWQRILFFPDGKS